MIVFLCSGIWHGAGWRYIVWGGLNGVFSVMEDIFQISRKRLPKLRIDTNSISYRFFCRIITFVLVDFTWLFFRAPNLKTAIKILKKIVVDFRPAWFIGLEYTEAFSDSANMMLVFVPLIVMAVIDIIRYYKIDIKAIIFRQQIVFRWIIYAMIMLAILYWGNYGTDYEQTEFIYFQF